MVDWHSPTELAHDIHLFSSIVHIVIGIYLWEFCISLPFDFSFISGKRKFRWPAIFYFVGRYSCLGSCICTLIAINVRSELDCQTLDNFSLVTGSIAIGMASINLSLRAMVVWEKKWYIVGPLVAIILGHWPLLIYSPLTVSIWVPGQGCLITSTKSKLLSATYIYGMSLDFIVILLTASKLFRPSMPRGRLSQMILADGLYYFVIVFLANLIATIFMTLDLNAVMSIIANAPAIVSATIAASRVVRRLANFSANVETFTPTVIGSSGRQVYLQSSTKPHTGVHVQMDTLKLSEPTSYDTEERVEKVGDLDSEAQRISNEF